VANGNRTIRLRYVNVKPSANPKPGMTLGLTNVVASDLLISSLYDAGL